MAKAERRKKNHKFQLNVNKEGELWLHEWIERLTKSRKFSQYVRDGLRLMIDLSAGNLDVLIELFPWVSERLTAVQPIAPAPVDNTDILRELQDLRQIVLERSIPDTSNDYPQMQKAAPKLTGKQLAAPQFALPVFDDDSELPTIITKGSTSVDSSLNFITALQHMQ